MSLKEFVATFPDHATYQHDHTRGLGNGFCAACALRDIQEYAPRSDEGTADLEAQVLHWKKVAMQEAGFAPDIIAVVCAKPTPLTPEEMERARKFAADWFAKRKQP